MQYQLESVLHKPAIKWYNDKSKLVLSILFWPLLVYGLYKTELISRRNKIIFVICFILIFIIGSIMPAKINGRYDLVVPKKDKYLFGDILKKQNAYFELKEDNTIHYHVESSTYGTINRWGKYKYKEDSKEVNIDWDDSNGPYVLNLKTEGGSYKFKIGETVYSQK